MLSGSPGIRFERALREDSVQSDACLMQSARRLISDKKRR